MGETFRVSVRELVAFSYFPPDITPAEDAERMLADVNNITASSATPYEKACAIPDSAGAKDFAPATSSFHPMLNPSTYSAYSGYSKYQTRYNTDVLTYGQGLYTPQVGDIVVLNEYTLMLQDYP